MVLHLRQLHRRRVQICAIARNDRDLCTFVEKCPRAGQADALAAAGDEHRASFQCQIHDEFEVLNSHGPL